MTTVNHIFKLDGWMDGWIYYNSLILSVGLGVFKYLAKTKILEFNKEYHPSGIQRLITDITRDDWQTNPQLLVITILLHEYLVLVDRTSPSFPAWISAFIFVLTTHLSIFVKINVGSSNEFGQGQQQTLKVVECSKKTCFFFFPQVNRFNGNRCRPQKPQLLPSEDGARFSTNDSLDGVPATYQTRDCQMIFIMYLLQVHDGNKLQKAPVWFSLVSQK